MKRLLLPLLLLAACQDPVDKAAKKRIFSPEDPPQAVAAASQKLPPEEAAENVKIARRILGMGAAETTERIGPNRYTATITWEWTAQGKNLKLKETRELLSGKGGVAGDFLARLANERDQGLEVTRVGGQVFARNTYGRDGAGRFRQRRRDRGMAERIREEAMSAVRDFDELFRGRIKLAAQGTQSVMNRTAWKYTVSLGPPVADGDAKLPPPAFAKGGADETTQRRLRFFDLRAPRTLQGEVLVDAETSVVLRTRLDGRIGVASDGGDAELRLVLESNLGDLGKDPGVKVPDDFLPDEDKPAGLARALERWGIQPAGADGGATMPLTDEPGDDATE